MSAASASRLLDGLATLATLASGAVFGFGLAWSTMVRPESVINFLTFQDFGLLIVLGIAVAINLLAYQVLPRLRSRPALGGAFQRRPFTLDRRAIAGGVLFGVGWGLCGVCPGPALAGIGAGNADLLVAPAAILAGALLHGLVFSSRGKGYTVFPTRNAVRMARVWRMATPTSTSPKRWPSMKPPKASGATARPASRPEYTKP